MILQLSNSYIITVINSKSIISKYMTTVGLQQNIIHYFVNETISKKLIIRKIHFSCYNEFLGAKPLQSCTHSSTLLILQ